MTRADKVLAFDSDGNPIVSETTLAGLESQASTAAASATAAAVSATTAADAATTAAVSETNASNAANNAATSAAAAQAAAGSMLWQDVVFKTQSDSPIAVAAGDAGVMFSIDASSGPVTIDLPAIASLTLPFNIGVKKTDGSGNAVVLNRAGTDTIDGASSKSIATSDAGAVIIADDSPAPDDWTTAEFGASAGNMTVDTFTDGADFTAGTTSQLTLSVDPGTAENIAVTFDGVTQHHTTFTVAGTTVNFTSAIPLGTLAVEIRIGTTLSIGAPSDGSVTGAKIALGSDSKGDFIVHDGATYVRLPVGSNDQIIMADAAAGAGVAWKTLAEILPAGSPIELESQTASSSLFLDFAAFDNASYRSYRLYVEALVPSADNQTLLIRTSTDGGATFDGGSSDYAYNLINESSSSLNRASATGAAAVELSWSGIKAGSQGIAGWIEILDPGSTRYTRILSRMHLDDEASNVMAMTSSGGARVALSDVNAVRLLFSSGNIASGSATLYGIKK